MEASNENILVNLAYPWINFFTGSHFSAESLGVETRLSTSTAEILLFFEEEEVEQKLTVANSFSHLTRLQHLILPVHLTCTNKTFGWTTTLVVTFFGTFYKKLLVQSSK